MPLQLVRFLPVVLACAPAAVPSASAADYYREETATAAETCQAALPAYDGAIRKRPMALVNEGVNRAFVTCGFSATNSGVLTERLDLYLVNTGSAYQTVSCTLVDGPAGSLRPRLYAVRALAVAPGGAPQRVSWVRDDPDMQVAGFATPALSCSLDPGTGIALSGRHYLETY